MHPWLKTCDLKCQESVPSRKKHNVIREMDRQNVDIMGISDLQWTDIFGIIVSKNITQSVTNCTLYSTRIIFIQLSKGKSKVNIKIVYAPTNQIMMKVWRFRKCTESHKIERLPNHNGDFKAKVRKERVDQGRRSIELESINEKGGRQKHIQDSKIKMMKLKQASTETPNNKLRDTNTKQCLSWEINKQLSNEKDHVVQSNEVENKWILISTEITKSQKEETVNDRR